MKTHRIALLAFTLTSVAALAAANAADMYVPAPAGPGGYKDGPAYGAVNWSGFYIGANGGYAWSETSNQLADATFGSTGLRPEGGFGGGQIGYNFQGVWHPHLVLGVEADIQGADISASTSFPDGLNTGTTTSKLDWFGTVRGRVGYAFDKTLVYFTGGLAYGNVDNSLIFTPCCAHYVSNGTETGYVLGGGIEYKIAPAWSVKAEYQYLNFGKNDPTRADGTKFSSFAGNTLNDDAFNTVRAGINYHFGSVYAPLK